jgi:hypothetical protein
VNKLAYYQGYMEKLSMNPVIQAKLIAEFGLKPTMRAIEKIKEKKDNPIKAALEGVKEGTAANEAGQIGENIGKAIKLPIADKVGRFAGETIGFLGGTPAGKITEAVKKDKEIQDDRQARIIEEPA